MGLEKNPNISRTTEQVYSITLNNSPLWILLFAILFNIYHRIYLVAGGLKSK